MTDETLQLTPAEILEELDVAKTLVDKLDIVRALATQYYEEGYEAGVAASTPQELTAGYITMNFAQH